MGEEAPPTIATLQAPPAPTCKHQPSQHLESRGCLIRVGSERRRSKSPVHFCMDEEEAGTHVFRPISSSPSISPSLSPTPRRLSVSSQDSTLPELEEEEDSESDRPMTPPPVDYLRRRKQSLKSEEPDEDDRAYHNLKREQTEGGTSVKETNILNCKKLESGGKLINDYFVVNEVGRGTYGKVKLCMHTKENRYYAMKILNKDILQKKRIGLRNALQDVKREIAILKKLDHVNIIKLHEVINDPSRSKMFLAMEYAARGEVMPNGIQVAPLDEETARRFFRDMCKGLEYLHSHGVIHRDLKPANLLVSAEGTVKISDFGVSHLFEGDADTVVKTVGTPTFHAPEVCSGVANCSGRAVDVWALGITLFYFIFGKCPFMGEGFAAVYDRVRHQELEFPCHVSPFLEDLLTRILVKEPEERLTLPEIMEHPWVTESGMRPLTPMPPQCCEELAITAEEVSSALSLTPVKSRPHPNPVAPLTPYPSAA